MKRISRDPPASRVVEEPKHSLVPYFAAAAVAAGLVWTFQQQSIQDATAPKAQAGKSGPNHSKGDLRTVFSADDYPAQAQRNGEEGTVQARLTVDRQGRVADCNVLRSSGHASLDNATCNILRRRARFSPARDADGKAIPSTVTTPPVVWRLEG